MNETIKMGRRRFIKYAGATVGAAAIAGTIYYTYVRP